MSITIITSASYAEEELTAEFGALPPAFLPVGHKRLYELQHEALGGVGITLTIPESFTVPDSDAVRIAALGISLVRVPDGLKLGESVLYALEMIGDTQNTVRIMHGDTLIYDIPDDAEDIVAVVQKPESYRWGRLSDSIQADTATSGAESEINTIMAGYFALSDGVQLRRSLARTRGDFVAAINDYASGTSVAAREVQSWLDFGHLQTYYRSRCSIRTQRAFNELEISFRVVEKKSVNDGKLSAEALWYDNIPPRLRLYTPGFLGSGKDDNGRNYYAIEYLPIPSLHELFVFGDIAPPAWSRVIESCFHFMSDCITTAGDIAKAPLPPVIRDLTLRKTSDRLRDFQTAAGIAADQEWKYGGKALPSLEAIAELTASAIDTDALSTLGVMHGDLCFTNIFFDFRTQRIRVIDPRGSIDGISPTVFGDIRYDMAKLSHSIAGAYDFILANRFSATGFETRDATIAFPKDSSFAAVNAIAKEFRVAGYGVGDREIMAITIHLFLSMLPLHADRPERQKAFVINALRLFSEGFES